MSLKPGWRWVRLGEVAENIDKFFDRSSHLSIQYVAGEHIDEGDLRVRRYGSTSDELVPPTFKRLFKAGDVLFHSRNLNKVAQPDFDGLTGEKIFVLRVKDQAGLLQDLLPWLLQSDHFKAYANDRWAGSTNKFLNKTPLMAYEFALPPVEEQKSAVALLRAAATQSESFADVAAASRLLMKSAIMDFFSRSDIPWKWEPIGSVGDVQLGQQKHPKYEAGIAPKPYLRVVNIGDGDLVLNDIKSMDFVERDYAKHRLKNGDVLVTEGDLVSAFNVGRAAIFRGEIEECCVQKSLIRFRPHPPIPSEYVLAAFRFLRYAGHFARAASTTTVSHLVANKFERVLMPIAPAEQQHELVGLLADIASAQKCGELRARQAAEIKRSIEQAVWG